MTDHDPQKTKRTEGSQAVGSTIDFHYIKSNQHRTIHVDGAYATIGPQGAVNLSVYSERFPIPQKVSQGISQHNQLLPEGSVESKSGIIREIDVTMTLLPSVADSIGRFLINKAEEAKRAREEAQKDSHGND